MSKCKSYTVINYVVALMLLVSSCTADATFAPPKQIPTPQATPTGPNKILPSETELTALMRRMVDKEKRATGMVIGMLVPDEKVVVGYGRLNETDDRFPDADSLFEIGSISKVFIGTLLADSVRRREVSLEDPAYQYLPSSVHMPDFKGTPITLLDLATHTSGLPKNLPDNSDDNIKRDGWVQAMYDFLSTYELPRKPGVSFEYSNLGMTLLAHILELRTGTPYETLLIERILQPLGMNDTRLTPTAEMLDRLATGHNSVLYPTQGYIYEEPALRYVGGIVSSANDMLKFAAAAMGIVETPLLPAFQDATQPRRNWFNDKSGLAWVVTEGSYPFIHHSGDTHGMHAFFGFDPERQVAVVVFSNAKNPMDDIGPHLLYPEHYHLQTYSPRILPTPLQLDPKVLESYTGQYELILDGELVATFTIKAEDQQLVVYKDGERDFSMIAETETRFVAVEIEIWLTFVVQDGIVTGFVLDQATAPLDYTFKRISQK